MSPLKRLFWVVGHDREIAEERRHPLHPPGACWLGRIYGIGLLWLRRQNGANFKGASK